MHNSNAQYKNNLIYLLINLNKLTIFIKLLINCY